MEQFNYIGMKWNSTMFKFHYVQMERGISDEILGIAEKVSLNSTMFRWNEIVESVKYRRMVMFKFHYVQMEPPLLTFQTYFNKA